MEERSLKVTKFPGAYVKLVQVIAPMNVIASALLYISENVKVLYFLLVETLMGMNRYEVDKKINYYKNILT